MSRADAVAAMLWTGVTAYAVFGGADFGAGFWSLVAGAGERGRRARDLIDWAIGPVWEANHVWLIFVLVVLWTGFSSAFASIFSTLFIPLSLAALGIVLRGAGFAFHKTARRAGGRWLAERLFGFASLLTPFFMGTVVGAVASGEVPVGNAAGEPVSSWTGPLPLLLGALFVATSAYLAAVFLVSDARRAGVPDLERYFTARALAAAVATGVLAAAGIVALHADARYVYDGLTSDGLPMVILSLVCGGAVLVLLSRGVRRGARPLAVGAVVAVVWGWAVAQSPYLLPQVLTIDDGAAASATLAALLIVFGVAIVLVLPSMALLFTLAQRDVVAEGEAPRPVSGWVVLAAIGVEPTAFLAVVGTAAVAGTVSAIVTGRGLLLPAVVVELLLGVVIGPQVLGLDVSAFIQFFADLGLGMLFFFAGYEIDLHRIAGRPLRLAAAGWAISLVLAYAIGGILAAAGIVLSLLYTGSAIATTAIGTLIPILSDSGELKTRFGTFLLAAGAVGEFGPILLVTLILSTGSAIHHAAILIAFVALAVAVALAAVRSAGRTVPLLERTLEKSSQLAVRWIVVLVFALVLLASELGLDLLLGGFAAGLITRQVLKTREVPAFDSKLSAVAFGFFIPFFFVVSGMQLDVEALFASPAGVVKLVVFFGLFLVVRGTPALLLYRQVLDRRERLALAFFSSTQLPLVLAITTLAQDGGHMRSSTAAALIGAAVLSTLVYPIVGLRLRSATPAAPAPAPA